MKLIVKKTLAHTMRWESKLVLAKYKPKVIAITGSVGKTSTKDAVYATIAHISHVRKSEKSFNSELGLPLTILGCPNGWNNIFAWLKNLWKGLWLFLCKHKYPKWLVLEVGIGKAGDMDRTASWLKTDAVIMTTIGTTPAHIEFFSSTKHLIEEKSKLIKTLKKDGLLVLNADDEAVLEMKHKTKCVTITYGFSEGADVVGSAESIFYNEAGEPAGLIFRVDAGGVSLPVTIEGVFGKNHIYAALASLALSVGLKFNLLNAIESLKNYEFPPGRMCLLKGINDTLIIDDTYNSSPFACESALSTLGEIKHKEINTGRKIAVLGDMLELGKHTEEAHKNIGKFASTKAEVLLVVGPRAKAIKDGALEAGMTPENIFDFSNSTEAGEFLKNFIKRGDMILVKGSQGMRMERTVGEILLDQENKEKLLVRQDAEWLAKK
jgi:UDP-N-acetylmuramoyl-tripeptide--D-alanyl-D-alanine ligase